jgi:hypothetical protein
MSLPKCYGPQDRSIERESQVGNPPVTSAGGKMRGDYLLPIEIAQALSARSGEAVLRFRVRHSTS